LKLNGTHQLLAYANDINILGGSNHNLKENTLALVAATADLTQLNPSQPFSNIPNPLKQLHSSRFLRKTLHHCFVYRHTVLSLWFYCNIIVPCLTSKNNASSDQDTVLILTCQCTEFPHFRKHFMKYTVNKTRTFSANER
jgi:hypothetical protein